MSGCAFFKVSCCIVCIVQFPAKWNLWIKNEIVEIQKERKKIREIKLSGCALVKVGCMLYCLVTSFQRSGLSKSRSVWIEREKYKKTERRSGKSNYLNVLWSTSAACIVCIVSSEVASPSLGHSGYTCVVVGQWDTSGGDL